MPKTLKTIPPTDNFVSRHNGPRREDIDAMLDVLGYDSLDDLIDTVVPENIRMSHPLALPDAQPEEAVLAMLREMADCNTICRSYIGMGYSDCSNKSNQ